MRAVMTFRGICALVACLAFAFLALPAQAQSNDAALLVADQVLITRDGRLVAEGNVEAFYEGTRLFTDKIIYDQGADKLIIPGPIRLSQPDGSVFLADRADLDSQLENGILLGARYVLNEELQLLSAQTDRVDGRYTVLRKVAASSCQICGDGPPIWQIRSERTIHDREEKQIYFRNASFRVLGVPVLYLPTMRIPDPTLTRANGFLIPDLVFDTQLGLGLRLPYFIKLGDHADVTLTPLITEQSRTLEFRLRRQFASGYAELNGAIGRDTLLPGQWRHYLTGYGAFTLAPRTVLSFDIETASDAGYRGTYGYSGKDRLGSGVVLTHIRRDLFFKAEAFNFETLRDTERNSTQPTLISNLIFERRFEPAGVGGLINGRAEFYTHTRTSTTDVVGRDMTRLSFDLDWTRDWTLAGGLRFGLTTAIGVDTHEVNNDSTATGTGPVVTPSTAARLSWPLQAKGADGARYLLEPIAQIGWAGGTPSTLPNDESALPDWDEGNLLALSRFPARDRRETGAIGAVGLHWQRHHAASWSLGATVGQVLRQTADPAFTPSSGLTGLQSNTLLSVFASTSWGGAIRARGLFDSSLNVVKSEAQFSLVRNAFSLTGNYIQLLADPAENRALPVREWSLNSTYKVSRHWTAEAQVQYDVLTGRAARTGGKVTYENECISIGLGATRSFARSSTLVPTTTFQLAVSLNGLNSSSTNKAARRQCSSY